MQYSIIFCNLLRRKFKMNFLYTKTLIIYQQTPAMNLAQYFSALNIFSRKQSAWLIKKGLVTVNDELITKPTSPIQEGDIIRRENQELLVKLTIVLLINKPTGFVSSDEDEYGRPSYKKLLENYVYAPLVHIA